ncbi:MAG: hypothetical protein MK105_12585 [Crocinitomicaceae bacterium]|nr:hypothetical protein [Crocinitomicaceae bacterium]
MNKILKLTIFLVFVTINQMSSQVTISPEIGFSYMPFTLYGANTTNVSNRIDPLIGFSAKLRIRKFWFIKTRISYSNRENIKWTDLCNCPGYEYNEFRHWDMNIDFSLLTNWSSFSFGIGPSFTKKFGELKNVNNEFEDQNTTEIKPYDIFGFNSLVAIDITKTIGITIFYNRILTDMEGLFSPDGQNRLDFILSYKLVSGGNR